MKKILVLLILLVISSSSMVWAESQSPISVVVFMNKHILTDGKAVIEMRDVLKEKFKDANSIVIYGDDQAKSPEFLEFIEKVKTDPKNEKDIRVIDLNELAKYGRGIKSSYVVLITISPCNLYWNFWSGTRVDMKASVSVLDVDSIQYVEYVTWYKEGTNPRLVAGAKDLINKVSAEFRWSPSAAEVRGKKDATPAEANKSAVVVFLPDVVLEKPDVVEKVRKSVSAKFHVDDVPVYIDDKPKSPEFLALISRVGTDSAKQQAFILKKENLVEYGKAVNSDLVTAIIISSVGGDDDFNYHLKEDIYVVDIKENKYLANVVFDTLNKMKRQDGIDFLMRKLQEEFKLP